MDDAAPHYHDDRVTIHHGDALNVLRGIPDNTIDAVITDPPYGLAEHRPAVVAAALTAWLTGDRDHVPDGRGFMGRAWDAFVPPPAVWDECLRVLRPGGHLLVFAGSRTADLMTLSLRLAGAEIRDTITWHYGSGFPKSLDVSKAIDRAAGAEREIVGQRKQRANSDSSAVPMNASVGAVELLTAPATDDARRWDGWGTALKPASEPIIVARKPLTGTVAANVTTHGTGALNIDACRVEGPPRPEMVRTATVVAASSMGGASTGATSTGAMTTAGRWPANVVLTHTPDCGPDNTTPCADGCPVTELDQQSGATVSGRPRDDRGRGGIWNPSIDGVPAGPQYGDSGHASRFFPTFRYEAKADTAERPVVAGVAHPTVKPLALMRWLVRLITPPGATVLEPFAGSGTTVEACLLEGARCVAIERDAAHLPLIRHRVTKRRDNVAHLTDRARAGEDVDLGLFALLPDP